MRRVAVLLSQAFAAILALLIQYAIAPSPLPEPGEYFLTQLAWGQIGAVSITLAMAAAFAFGFFTKAHPLQVAGAMIAVFPLISIYEAMRFRGSHNLIPFEFAIFALGAIPLALAAWSGRMLVRRLGRTGPRVDGAGG